jgi:hypothetical protein
MAIFKFFEAIGDRSPEIYLPPMTKRDKGKLVAMEVEVAGDHWGHISTFDNCLLADRKSKSKAAQ